MPKKATIPDDSPDRLFTPEEVAAYWGIPLTAVRAAVRGGTLDYITFTATGARLMRFDAIREWFKDLEHATMATHDDRVSRYRKQKKGWRRKPVCFIKKPTKQGGFLRVAIWNFDTDRYRKAIKNGEEIHYAAGVRPAAAYRALGEEPPPDAPSRSGGMDAHQLEVLNAPPEE